MSGEIEGQIASRFVANYEISVANRQFDLIGNLATIRDDSLQNDLSWNNIVSYGLRKSGNSPRKISKGLHGVYRPLSVGGNAVELEDRTMGCSLHDTCD